MRIYTKTGDDGTSGLFYGGRLSKDDLRFEAIGACDEAVAALGSARAALTDDEARALVLRLQRELFAAGAEFATAPENRAKLSVEKGTLVSEDMIAAVERDIDEWESRMEMPQEFVIPGGSAAGAALDLARAVVRRCERRAVGLARASLLGESVAPKYLNRIADLLFVLARVADGGFTPLHG